jgi:hypothetical protein
MTISARRRLCGDILAAWLVATLVSGLPSTLHAWLIGADVLQPTRAAAAMLVSRPDGMTGVLAAAALVHAAVSLFWSALVVVALPRRHVVVAALLAAAAIALVDLRLIAPSFFPEVAALPFWPQFADHLMWGLGVACALLWRRTTR